MTLKWKRLGTNPDKVTRWITGKLTNWLDPLNQCKRENGVLKFKVQSSRLEPEERREKEKSRENNAFSTYKFEFTTFHIRAASKLLLFSDRKRANNNFRMSSSARVYFISWFMNICIISLLYLCLIEFVPWGVWLYYFVFIHFCLFVTLFYCIYLFVFDVSLNTWKTHIN